MGLKKIDDYPLVIAAAITEDNATTAYNSTQSTYLGIAYTFSVLIAFLMISAAFNQLKNIEQLRREAEIQNTFRLAVDGAHEAFYMIQPTFLNGHINHLYIQDCNERAAEMAGYIRSNLIGKCCTDIYQGKTVQSLRDFFAHVLKEGFVEDEFHVSHGKRHVPGW